MSSPLDTVSAASFELAHLRRQVLELEQALAEAGQLPIPTEQLPARSAQSEQKAAELSWTDHAIKALAFGTASASGQGFLQVLVRQLSAVLKVRYAFVTEWVPGRTDRLRTVAGWCSDRAADPVEYELSNTPCQQVLQNGEAFFSHDVQQLFPQGPYLAAHNVESYMGVSLLNSAGRPTGHLCVMDVRPFLFDRSQGNAIMKVFAERAAAELERFRAEEALRQREERLRTLYDDNPSMYFTLSADGTIMSVNRFGAEQLGYGQTDLIGQSVLGVFDRKDHQTVLDQLRTCSSNPYRLFEWEIQKIRKDGTKLWVNERARAIHDQTGRPLVLVVCEDITAQKTAEQTIHSTAQTLQTLVRLSPVAIMALAPDGETVTIWNQAAESMFGWRADEVLGRPAPFLPTDKQAESDRLWDKLLREGCLSGIELQRTRRDGTPIDLALWATLLKDEPGCVTGALGFMVDITERKRAYSLLQAAINSTADGLLVVDRQGKISSINQKFLQLWRIPDDLAQSEDDEALLAFAVGQLRDPETFLTKVKDLYAHPELESFDVIEFKDGRVYERYSRPQVLNEEIVGRVWSFRDMTARISTESLLRESEQAIRSLQEATSAPGLTFEERMETILELGCRRFRLPIGMLSRVADDQLEVRQVWPPTTDLSAGTLVPLSQTYCQTALRTSGPMSFEHAGASEWSRHPGYEALGFECYLGTKLAGQRKAHGTICFFGRDPYPGTFSDADKDFLLLIARWIAGELDRREVEQAVKEQEGLLRSVVETAGDAIFMKDADGRYLLINSFGASVIGKPAEEIIGKNDLELFPTETALRIMADDRRVLAGTQAHHLETIIPFNGEPRTFSSVKTPHRDYTGKNAGLVGIARDMTILKKTEEALRISEERFKIAFRSSPHPVIITELASGRCLEVNDASLKLFGYDREEVIGQTTITLGLWPSPEDRARFFQQLREDGAIRNREISLRTKDRKARELLVSSEVIELNGTSCLITVGHDITEHKQAEAALRESEERFAKAFRSSPYPIVISELESGLCLDANDAAIHMFGYRREEVAGQTVDQLGLWPTPDHRRRFIAQLKKMGAVRNVEASLRMKSGEYRHCLTSAEQIELNGKTCMVTIGLDVTEQRRAEQALRLTQFAVDHGADMAFWIDSEARLLYVNDAACQRLGYSRDELLSMTVADIDPDYQLAIWPQHWNELRKEGRLRFESRQRAKTGEIYPTEIVANYVSFEGKEYNFAFVRDISDQKRAETALRDSETRMHRFVADAPVGLVILGPDRRLIKANKAFCELTGYAEHEVLGKTYELYTHPEDLPSNLALTDEFYQGTRSECTFEKRYVRKSGEIIWVSVKATRVELPGHPGPLLLAAVQDITEQKLATEEREQLSQDLHDNILQSLYAVGMQLEAGKLALGQSPRKSKNHMIQAIDQLNHLMLDVRQFITLLKQRSAARPDFGQALRQLVTSLSATGQAAPELEIKDPVLLFITPAQGEQLLNIAREALSNSMRHAQATHRSVRLSHTANTIRLVICDDGIGFASKRRRHRGHGLANMAARAEKIHARFTLDSAPGKGTCVTVDVPMEEETAHA